MRKIKGLFLIILTLVFSYFYFINIKVNCPQYAPCILAAFICCITYLAYELYGFPRFNDTPIQIIVLKGIITLMVIYFISIYVLGIFAGFNKNVFTLTTLVTVISLIATEIYRYILINANRDSDMFPLLTTLTIIILELTAALDVNTMINTSTFVIYLATVITPVVLRNLILTLYCQHINIRIAIIYSIIVLEYKTVIPIVPNLNEFTYAFADIILSFLILSMSYRVIVKNYEGYPMIGLKDGLSLLDFLLFLILVFFGVLVGGTTPFQLYVAKNDIKNVSIEKGDAPLIVKGIDEYDIEEKDIIMYLTENDELKIYPINTVEKIKPSDVKQKDIIKLYVLNENNELTLIDNSRIKYKVLYNIKYLFKPALTIQEKLGGGAK